MIPSFTFLALRACVSACELAEVGMTPTKLSSKTTSETDRNFLSKCSPPHKKCDYYRTVMALLAPSPNMGKCGREADRGQHPSPLIDTIRRISMALLTCSLAF